MADTDNVTRLLTELRDGHGQAAGELLPLVYDQLRAVARREFERERKSHTLQPTALVHEAYLQLVDRGSAHIKDQQHFLALAATVMRRLLIDHARGRGRLKRGAGYARMELDDVLEVFESDTGLEFHELHDSLERLTTMDERKARVVEMRFFGGMTGEEIAEVLDISPKTVKREWAVAKAWLYQDMTGADGNHE